MPLPIPLGWNSSDSVYLFCTTINLLVTNMPTRCHPNTASAQTLFPNQPRFTRPSTCLLHPPLDNRHLQITHTCHSWSEEIQMQATIDQFRETHNKFCSTTAIFSASIKYQSHSFNPFSHAFTPLVSFTFLLFVSAIQCFQTFPPCIRSLQTAIDVGRTWDLWCLH